MTQALAIGGLIRRVRDLPRSTAFYAAIGFRPDGEPERLAPDLAGVLGLPAGAPVQRLRIGRQRLDLVADPAGEPSRPAANDPAFQHVAIPVRDMAAAMAFLAPLAPEPISRGGAQVLPASSGGVAAFKFRDPDGHPLELIAFPSGDAAARWAGAPGLFLGIDHTAITVSSLEEALAFFEGRLGFRLAGRGLNQGPEQARLDGLADPVVDVLTLVPPGRATPHLELLHYRTPAFGAAAAPATPTTWTVLQRTGGDRPGPMRADAPDGHGLVLLTPPSPPSSCC